MNTTILEGPDGAGKTTLAEKLANCGTYQRHGLYEHESGLELLEIYTNSILKGGVIDRCFLSELVYGKVMRNNDRLGILGRTLLTRLCWAQGVTEVICLPPRDVCYATWKRRVGHEYVTKKEKWEAVYRSYRGLLRLGFWYQHCDYTKDDVVTFSTNPKLPRGVIGSQSARFLIVGEQIGKTGGFGIDLPFYGLKGVSAFFFQILNLAWAKEEDLAFVNAYDKNGKLNDLKSAVARLPGAKIISLGQAAFQACSRLEITSTVVPHPSYWYRFHRDETGKYVKMWKETFRG